MDETPEKPSPEISDQLARLAVRSRRLVVRVTENEYKALHEHARKVGQTLADYLVARGLRRIKRISIKEMNRLERHARKLRSQSKPK